MFPKRLHNSKRRSGFIRIFQKPRRTCALPKRLALRLLDANYTIANAVTLKLGLGSSRHSSRNSYSILETSLVSGASSTCSRFHRVHPGVPGGLYLGRRIASNAESLRDRPVGPERDLDHSTSGLLSACSDYLLGAPQGCRPE